MTTVKSPWRDGLFTYTPDNLDSFRYAPFPIVPPGLYVQKPAKPPKPDKIIVCGPATIVFWDDKTKTIVKCSEDDTYDLYSAFCAAFAKKMYGTNSGLKKMIRKALKKKGEK